MNKLIAFVAIIAGGAWFAGQSNATNPITPPRNAALLPVSSNATHTAGIAGLGKGVLPGHWENRCSILNGRKVCNRVWVNAPVPTPVAAPAAKAPAVTQYVRQPQRSILVRRQKCRRGGCR